MNKILIKIIIYFAKKNLPAFIKLLAKLEYGVSACLKNLASEAEKDNYLNLAKLLKEHSQHESSHGKMLATLIDGKRRINLRNNGRWLSLLDGQGNEIANHPEPGNGKIIVYEDKIGIFEHLDGISQRYLSLRILLKGKKINQLSWKGRIACMACLEEGAFSFYNELATADIPAPLKAVVTKIAAEEASHANYFKHILPQFTSFSETELDVWRCAIAWASLGLIWDFWKWTRS